jgi:flagellar biosynthetic protein FliR
MGVDALLADGTLFGFLFMLARISGVFAFLPLAAFRATPDAPKIVLSLALTLMLRPQWKAAPASAVTMGGVVAGLAGEAALGIAIGVSLAIVFEVFQMAAQAVSMTAGFGYASTIDPTSGADSTVLLTTAQLTAGLLFFATGADRLLVKALSESVRLVPPESFKANRVAALALIQFGATIFTAGLRLAMPVTALLLLADAALAVLGRVQSQLHLISLTMPLKLAATMLILSVMVVLQPGFFESLVTAWAHVVEGILRTGH